LLPCPTIDKWSASANSAPQAAESKWLEDRECQRAGLALTINDTDSAVYDGASC